MRKRRLGLTLFVGVALAILVTACGVALGPVQFTAGGPVVSPILNGWQGLAGSHQRAVTHAMLHVQNVAAAEQHLILNAFGVGHCHELP